MYSDFIIFLLIFMKVSLKREIYREVSHETDEYLKASLDEGYSPVFGIFIAFAYSHYFISYYTIK